MTRSPAARLSAGRRLPGKGRLDCLQSPLSLWHGRCNPKPRMRSCITSPTRGRAWFKARGLQHGCCRRTRLPELTWLAPSANGGPSCERGGPGSLAGSVGGPANLHHHQHRAPRDPAPKDPLACRPPDRSLGHIARAAASYDWLQPRSWPLSNTHTTSLAFAAPARLKRGHAHHRPLACRASCVIFLTRTSPKPSATARRLTASSSHESSLPPGSHRHASNAVGR